MQVQKTYYPSRYYTSFCSIPEKKYLQKVHYFEKHEQKINHLNDTERHRIIKGYLSALFNIKAFTKYIAYSEVGIHMALNHELEENLQYFYLILYRKMVCYFHKGDYEETDKLCRQLYKMKQPYAIDGYFIKANKRMIRSSQQFYKKAIVFTISLAAIVYFINTIFVLSFYPALSPIFEIAVFSLVGLALSSLFVSEIYATVKAKRMLSEIMA